MSVKKFTAGVKAYRQTYWASEYVPLDSDILACFKITPQAGVDHEEAAAAVVAESSTGTWTTVWTDLLTDLVYYKGRAYRIEDVPGDDTCFDCFDVFVAYPTGVGCLGISVNRINSGGNKYDFSRFAKINQLVGIPLGIHGSAGFTDDQLRRMISFGAAKINYCEPLFKVAARRKC